MNEVESACTFLTGVAKLGELGQIDEAEVALERVLSLDVYPVGQRGIYETEKSVEN